VANRESDADNLHFPVDSKGHRGTHLHLNIFFASFFTLANWLSFNQLIFVVVPDHGR
jgi:hypothetical protein